VRHFRQLLRNWAFASSRLGARPLVVMPSMGYTYTVIDQNQRGAEKQGGTLCTNSPRAVLGVPPL
jgi:hypothetical protein